MVCMRVYIPTTNPYPFYVHCLSVYDLVLLLSCDVFMTSFKAQFSWITELKENHLLGYFTHFHIQFKFYLPKYIKQIFMLFFSSYHCFFSFFLFFPSRFYRFLLLTLLMCFILPSHDCTSESIFSTISKYLYWFIFFFI